MTQTFKPHSYQQDAVDHIIENPNAGLFLPMGLGKTASTLSAIRKLKHEGEIDRVLIIAPIRVAYLVWPLEVKKWANFENLSVEVCHGKNRAKALNSDSDIVVINPEGLQWLARYMGSKAFTFKGKKWMLVVDESSNFKNARSVRFKILKKLIHNFCRRIIMTGTPAPNGLLQLWSQIFLLDQGERLGKNFTGYRNRYFYAGDYMGYTYALHDWAEEAIYKKIDDIVIHKSTDELDLPDRIDNIIPIELDSKASKLYKQMKRDMMFELQDETVTAVNAGVVVNKLKQISNGGIYNEEGEAIAIHDEKTKACQEIVDSLAGRPCLIFYEYKHDLTRLKNAFPLASVLGDDTDLEQLVSDWNEGKIPILLIQVARGAHGLNLQGGDCHDVVWYSLPYDLELYLQACGRVHRQGVKNSVTIHHLVGQDTIDERIIEVIRDKTKVQDKLLENLLK